MPACSIPRGYVHEQDPLGMVKNSLRSGCAWGGIFYLLLGDEKLAEE